ncbi:MAG TPA: hypothetical protein VLK33_12110 [Terriglobales bacterium]|nr:hypothetical protein [Terriglobales bacterium]
MRVFDLQQRQAFERELSELESLQPVSTDKAAFLRMSQDERDDFETRGERINQLLELLA